MTYYIINHRYDRGLIMGKTKELSDCIPESLVAKIMQNGKEQSDQHVYRVAKNGRINNDVTFMGTYEESLHEGRPFDKDRDEIGSYSTSCYLTLKRPRKFLKLLKKKYFDKYPQPGIIHGYTICGLSQLTRERIPDYEDDHVDWWIYKDSFCQLFQSFHYVEDSERGVLNE